MAWPEDMVVPVLREMGAGRDALDEAGTERFALVDGRLESPAHGAGALGNRGRRVRKRETGK